MTPITTGRRRHHALRSVLAVVGVLVLGGNVLGQALQSRLEAAISNSAIGETKFAVHVIDCTTNNVLASSNPDASMIPASNMKLLTSGAALSTLRPDFVFRTELLRQPATATTPERIILKGSGDPALGDPKLLAAMGIKADDIFDEWAKAAAKSGTVKPEVVIDDRVFDRQYVHPTWPANQLNRWYCSEVTGINYHTNLLAIFTDCREIGRPPRLTTEPSAPWIQITNKARCVNEGRHSVWVAPQPNEPNTFILSGDARHANEPVEVCLQNTPNVISRLLEDALNRAGVSPSKVRLADAEETFPGATAIHVVQTPMSRVLDRCNKDSYNLYAECLLKRMGNVVTGAPGSWPNGSTVVRMVLLDRLGPAAGQAFTVADGSGMSRENRVTTRMLAAWLVSLQSDETIADTFIASLPKAGEEGTLRKRFHEHGIDLKNDVRAKTGYISGVSSLSGYVLGANGNRRVAFSIIANDKPNRVSLDAIWKLQESIVETIDKWITRAGDRG
ncbi:MAG TPA: D-alanyl-D-alanine carboxypeptidase/D-alanyl-D-alanine-endopeptidase [Phycisphaerales bacterium]|nr:D-alanyl-D-alanine carboxypeptidase/D-alanyl-D-alanine-endopeptidase [Phycisphaerales bacterium]